jgi:hypothetical protein
MAESIRRAMDHITRRTQRLEMVKAKALECQDALPYFRSCERLGMPYSDVEDQLLYERGFMEAEKKEEKRSALEAEVEKHDHEVREKKFLSAGKFLDLDYFISDVDSKAGLLAKYFPGQFGPKGNQPIHKYSEVKQGFIFRQVYNSYYDKHNARK